ncbi:MAG TPA: imidazolonepropionase [Dokdonella sp.]|uniref:imidazolonepropionase n=1 Tax=Dokdonella sp. TaxID=2291710 RepID=UPI0025C6F241|nr:imidazolonepropionase [Dokdonella sp.]MBX3693134.1 imidazolonepropionase [Dokdonella sp.]HNR91757.1 imidazolonepropionase [Dokdonella sp.]
MNTASHDDAWDGLLLDVRLATLADTGMPYGAIERAALGWKDGRIVFAGALVDLPAKARATARQVESLDGAWITPGLIDCHTHLVFGGDRAHEFELRLEGASYEDIARAGGGIASTVRATRERDDEALLAASLPRARALLADGVTTVEIKSGYGLDLDSELKMLRVARAIGTRLGLGVRTTFLGAHALPPEFAGRQSEYVEHICATMLPAVAASGLADAVDAFCEKIAFTPSETRRVFDAARALGLPVKLHADQLSDLDGAALCASFGGLSADHIEHTSAAGVAAMAAAGTVAVLLPGAFYALRDTCLPPIAELRAQGVPMAVASDLNPGTSPLLSLRLAMNMACVLFRLTPEEALRGATVHAARALGLGDRGRLAPGQRADFVAWDIGRPADLCYWIGGTLARRVWIGGQ